MSSIFQRMNRKSDSEHVDKRRRLDSRETDDSRGQEKDRFWKQCMELHNAVTGSHPRSPSPPFNHIWNLSVTEICPRLSPQADFPSKVFIVVPSRAPPGGFPLVLEDEREILMRDPWVFELLCLEVSRDRDAPEIFLSLKTRLVGSQDQIFPGKDLDYFNLSLDKGSEPPRLWCLTERGITFAELSHDMTPTSGFMPNSGARTFSYFHAMQAKKGTPEYLSCHPHSEEAVRYHASFARPTSKPEIFSFVGAEDFPMQGTTKSSSSSSRAPHITCSEEFAHMRGLPNDSLRERIARRGQSPSIMAPLAKAHKGSTFVGQYNLADIATSSSGTDTSDDEETTGRSKEKFATDRFNGQSLTMKLQMNTNLSELFANFELSRFLRNNGDPELLGFVLDHKLAPLEKTQFVAGVKAFLNQKASLLARPVLLQKLLGLTVLLEPDLLYLFCTDCFRLTTNSASEVDDKKFMLAYCLPPTAFTYGTDDARTAFSVLEHKKVPQWTSAMAKLSEAVGNLGELFTAILKPSFRSLWVPIYSKVERLNSSSNCNRNTEFIAYELQYRLAQFVEYNHLHKTPTPWTTEQFGAFFKKHVIRTFLEPAHNTELIQELQFRQQSSSNSALSLFPRAIPSITVKQEPKTPAANKVGKKEKKSKKAKTQHSTSTAAGPTLYTEEEAKAKFGQPKTSDKAAGAHIPSAPQPRSSNPTAGQQAHPKGTQYCRHYLLQQLGVKNLDTKELYSCARGSCRPGNHNLVTVDSTSTKQTIKEFLALQISVDSFLGTKAEVPKQHLDKHVASL